MREYVKVTDKELESVIAIFFDSSEAFALDDMHPHELEIESIFKSEAEKLLD